LISMRPRCGAIGETLNVIATDLTDLERQYLHKRIAEEHAQLERLEKSLAQQRSVLLEV
jgi:5-bromo-4-chloroindolyl phosphate hydrolysis protein